MSTFHVQGKVEVFGPGQPVIDFDLAIFADDATQARAAIKPLIEKWPHLVTDVKREEPPAPDIRVPVCIACGCDELHACRTAAGHGCSWILINHERAAGLCSECFLQLGFEPEALVGVPMSRPSRRGDPVIQIVRPEPAKAGR